MLTGGSWWRPDAGLAVSVAGSSPYAPPPGQEEQRTALGTPSPTSPMPEGTGYRFLGHQSDGRSPVTWSPCRPIHYVTRPDNQPAFGPQITREAIALVAAATGLHFIDDGPTTEGPTADRASYQPARYGNRWAPVLIGWASANEVPDFGVDIVGEAGAAQVRTPSGDSAYITGALSLDAGKLAEIAGVQGTAAARAIVMHELGHLVGLAHVNAPDQIMFPRGGGPVIAYAAGDRAGLAALGRGSCQPDI